MQTTLRKCANSVQERDSEGQAKDVRLRAWLRAGEGLTLIERLRALHGRGCVGGTLVIETSAHEPI